MAKEKVVKLEVESNVDDVTKEFVKLDKGIEKTTKSIDELNKSTEKLEKTNKKLEKSADKFAKKSSSTYKKTNKEVSKLDENLKKSNEGFRAGSEVIGFVGESMQFVGVESEALEESLGNVDSAMKLGKGLKGLKDATTTIKGMGIQAKITAGFQALLSTAVGTTSGALKIFRLALISTGIGAIVVAIGMLVANWEKLSKAVDGGAEGFKKSSVMVKVLMVAFAPLILTIKAVQKGLELIGLKSDDNAEKEKKRAEMRKEIAEEEEKQWNDRKDRLNKEFELRKKLAQKEIDVAKARGEKTAEAERKIIEDSIKDAKKNAKEDRKKFEEEAGWMINHLEERVQAIKDSEAVIQKIREKGLQHRHELTRKERRILADAGISEYDFTVNVNKKLKHAQDELTEYREKHTKKWIKTTQEDVKLLEGDLEIFDLEQKKSDKEAQEEKADNYRKYVENRLDAQRELQDREMDAEMTALQTQKTLLEAHGEDLTEINQQIFEKELEQEKVNWEREYDDVLKNEKLTRKEKNAIREAMEKEWQATEKQMRAEQNAIEIEEAREQAEKLAEIEKERQENIAGLELDFYARLEEINNEYYDSKKTAEQLEIQAVRDKYFTIEEEAKQHGEDIKNIVALREAQIKEIEDKYADLREAERKKELQDRINVESQKAQVGIDALRLIGSIAEATAGDDVERQKRAFNIKKASDIASATMDGFKAVLSAYAQTPGGPVLKGIAGAIAGAFAGVQISNIAKQKFESPTGDVESSSQAGGGGDIITPEFNIVGGAELTDLEGVGQQPLQAYVVSGDVTTAQSLDRNRVENATI